MAVEAFEGLVGNRSFWLTFTLLKEAALTHPVSSPAQTVVQKSAKFVSLLKAYGL